MALAALQKAMRRGLVALMAVFGGTIPALALTSMGDQTQPPRVVNSRLPYWEVGILDRKLSRLCSLGQFNTADRFRIRANFTGPVGSAVLAVARGDGWNLEDPTKAARKADTYYFHQDGSASCEVFFWNSEQKRKRMGPQVYQSGSSINEFWDLTYERPEKDMAGQAKNTVRDYLSRHGIPPERVLMLKSADQPKPGASKAPTKQ
jgi:hypothetical protein